MSEGSRGPIQHGIHRGSKINSFLGLAIGGQHDVDKYHKKQSEQGTN
jgi:hypothetical protein